MNPSLAVLSLTSWLTAWLTAAVLLAVLTWRVQLADGPMPSDQFVADRVAALASEPLTALMHGFHELQGKAVALLIVLGLALLAWRRQWRDLVGLLAMVPLGMLANSGLKLLVERPRPEPLAAVETHGFSYPSGHALAITLLCGYLVLRVFRATRRLPWRTAALVGTLALVATAGLSRIVLGAHHPSDVLASVLFGVLWLGLCATAARWLERPLRPELR